MLPHQRYSNVTKVKIFLVCRFNLFTSNFRLGICLSNASSLAVSRRNVASSNPYPCP